MYCWLMCSETWPGGPPAVPWSCEVPPTRRHWGESPWKPNLHDCFPIDDREANRIVGAGHVHSYRQLQQGKQLAICSYARNPYALTLPRITSGMGGPFMGMLAYLIGGS